MILPNAEKESPLVLIVERDRFFRRYLESFFKDLKCEFEFAQDGMTTLKRIKIRTPDLLILDVSLPRIDGLSVCKHIHSDPATAKIPILVFSSIDVKSQALEAGARDFLLKPFDEPVFSKFISPYLKFPEEGRKP